GFLMGDPLLDRFVLGLIDAPRPRICFVPTASGDADRSVARFFEAFPSRSFEPSVLRLFDREVEDVAAFLGEQDVVYVGGGNTLNMLAVWRLHGVDTALRTAWEAGVVMAGISAGANCWFEASTTDSYRLGRADALRDGLGFVHGSFTPHYSGEPARRPSLLALVGRGELPDGLTCDDFAAVHIVDDAVREAVASVEGARAYRVRRDGDAAVEEALTVRSLG
ncbi:MAG: Type 1 glutamine amidotransferase-like domain-containing protein, partial [Actinomycetota bacterium]